MDRQEIYKALDKAYFSEEPHEKHVLAALPPLLAHARIFVDVGASLGQYTFHANKIMQNARIYAIEADPIRFDRLQENCTLWQADSNNHIEAIHAAASDLDGSISFYSTESALSGGLFKRDADASRMERAEQRRLACQKRQQI